VEIVISDFRQEVHLKLATAMKAHAMCRDGVGLVPLTSEAALCDPIIQFGQFVLPKDSLKTFNEARTEANRLLEEHEVSSGLGVCSILEKKRQSLIAIDSSFVVELSWLKEMCDQGGAARLQHEVLSKLPCGAKRTTLKEAAAQIAVLKRSSLYLFVSESARGSFDVVAEILHNMLRQVSPDFVPQRESFLEQVLGKCAFFMAYEVKEQGKLARTIHGDPALQAMWNSIMDKDGPKLLKDLSIFATFKWLLTTEQQLLLADAVKKTIGASTTSSAGGGKKLTKKTASTTTSASSGPTAADDNESKVLSLFA
jgi:hypothetical protein